MVNLSTDQLVIMALVFVLGLVLGMAAMAGGKWKQRYREEMRLRQAAEAERDRLAAAGVRHGEVHDRHVRDDRPLT